MLVIVFVYIVICENLKDTLRPRKISLNNVRNIYLSMLHRNLYSTIFDEGKYLRHRNRLSMSRQKGIEGVVVFVK
jgi:hypothetical protein